ncbi:MAG: MmcQ/YjbR family DNA-binding protein [Planctomycetes bacterium]|nr:MmcQ/YjbR family DNA-binding protein [Planctomycetota bacterium]MCB9885194.1 MmcQ/YjbR family DNA-binding protein [Planctomycetota bacterium]
MAARAATFRRLALALPDTEEGAHHGHPDFRHEGRVFASLQPGETVGMVILPPPRQQELLARGEAALRPANGAWGRQGCTLVELAAADQQLLRELLTDAWQFAAAKTAAKRTKK